MPIVYPTDWLEVCYDTAHQNPPPDQTDVKLKTALDLLQNTQPVRYDKLSTANLLSRMNRNRDTGLGSAVRGLRIFVYKFDTVTKKAKIAVFYFVRLKNTDIEKAYCMTAGVDSTVTGAVAYAELKNICKFMQTQNPGIQIEIVFSERHFKHIRKDSDGAKVLIDAYDIDYATPTPPGPLVVDLADSDPDDPWIPPIKRWLIKNV